MDTKTCKWCGGTATRREIEGPAVWSRRNFCSKKCAAYSNAVGRVPPSQKGKTAWNKGLKKFNPGELNGVWKGDKVTYRPLHSWVQRSLGTPYKCEFCKKSNLRSRQYHWANKSHQYKRELSDWIRLCVKCHMEYDKKTV